MEVVVFWFAIVIAFSLYGMHVNNSRPNPVLLRCSACDSKLYVFPRGGWAFVHYFAWLTGSWLIVWRLNVPFLIGGALVLALVHPWRLAVERLTHTYWTWKHPIRCQGGGHIQPVPS